MLSSCGVWICVVSQYPEGYLAAKGKGNEEKNGVSVIDEEDEMEPKGKRKSGGKKKRKFIGRSDVRYVLYVSEMHPDRENNFFQFGWKKCQTKSNFDRTFPVVVGHPHSHFSSGQDLALVHMVETVQVM